MELSGYFDRIVNYIKDPRNRPIFLGIAIFLIIFVPGLIFINNSARNREIDEAKKITKEEKNDILSQVLKNNTKSAIPTLGTEHDETEVEETEDSNSTPHTTPSQAQNNSRSGYIQVDPATGLPIQIVDSIQGFGSPGNPTATDPSEVPDLNQYNFRKTTTITTPGPAKARCAIHSYIGDQIEVSENFQYFDKTRSFYKTVRRDSDNNLLGFYLSKYGNDINENYSFADGAYGVIKKYNINRGYSTDMPYNTNPASYPVSYAETNAEVVERNFGGNAEILRVIEKDGKKYYEIRNQYEFNCNVSLGCGGPGIPANVELDVNAGEANLTTISLVDSETFRVIKTDNYLGEAEPNNLLYSNEMSVSTDLVGYEEVANEFVYGFTSELKTVNYVGYRYSPTEYANRVNNYIKANNQEIMVPNPYVSYIYLKNMPSAVENDNYYRDRAYYPTGSRGDALFDKAMATYGIYNPLVSASFRTSANDSSFSLNQYEEGAKYEQIAFRIKQHGSKNVQEYKINLNVDGSEVEANVFEFRYASYSPVSYAVSYPVSFPVSYPISYPLSSNDYVSYAIIFEYEGKFYQIWAYNIYTFIDAAHSKYVLLDISNDQDYQFISKQITEAYTN